MRLSSAIGLAVLGPLGSWRLAFAQCPDGTPPPCRVSAKPAPVAANTIAVLYFDNLSRDTADVYLADGLTEELISRLAQVERLQVKSRTAVRRLRGRDTDPEAIGRTLAVAQLLSGSVLRSGGRLRVNVELTRAATGNSVWGRSFERADDDLLGVQAEIAESIAVHVGGRLAPIERARIQRRPTTNAAAYDRLLRGRFQATRRTTAGLLGAIREFEAAVRLDSTLTSALVGAALAYRALGTLYYGPEAGMPRDSLNARARALVDRAVRQDTMSAEALMARTVGSGDVVANRQWLTRAVALEPRNADAHHGLGLTLRMLGEDSAAAAAFKRAVDLEPDRVISLENLGQLHLVARRFAEANRWLDSAVALRPDAAFYYLTHAFGRLHLGDTAGARASAALVARHGSLNGREMILAMIEARRGDSVAARARMLAVDAAMTAADCILSHECLELSFTLASVGARARALDVFERIQPRSSWLAYWSSRPEFDSIRDDPRFQRVVAESRAARVYDLEGRD